MRLFEAILEANHRALGGDASAGLRPSSRRACVWVALWLAASMFDGLRVKAAVIEAWLQRYNGPANTNDVARAVVIDGNGNVVVTGYSQNGAPNFDLDYYTAKYAATNGALLWEKRYNGPANDRDYALAVAVDGSDNVFVTGSSEEDYYTAKYAGSDGALLWDKRYNGPARNLDRAHALAVDQSGDVIVTGGSWGIGSNDDYYTAKYAGVDGTLLWEKRYNGSASSSDLALAVATDTSGNIVVTGYSEGSGTAADYYTVKYAAVDGALLWEKRYNGPASAEDFAHAVAIDGSGNVIVTGNSVASPGHADYYTAKYAAADGALVWEKRYNGPAGSYDQADAVTVDRSGNVIVTGGSYGTGLNFDYYTAKYAAADGMLLWDKRYNGVGNTDDYASTVALDVADNVVVTGFSGDIASGDDYYTAKYAAADGTLIWEQRYRGRANGRDLAFRLAVGRDGTVAVTGVSGGDFGEDYATIVYREPLPPVSIELVPDGIRIRFSVESGQSCQIQRAGAVSGSWSTLITLTASLDGIIEYTDTNPPAGQAFYRTAGP